MTDHRNRSNFFSRIVAVLVAIALSIVMVACSKGESAEKKKETSKENQLKECKGVDIEKTEDLPPKCAEALYAKRIADSGSKELSNLDDQKLMDIGHGICSLASAIASDPTQAADFDEMVKANSKNWGISADSVKKVMDKATVLCPESMARMKQLTGDQGPTTVTFEASGSAKVQVSYRGTDSDKADQVVDPPWTQKVKVSKPGRVELTVFPSATAGVTTGCRITIEGVEVASATGGEGEMSVCTVSEGQIRAARSGQAVTPQTTPAEQAPTEPGPSADDPSAPDTTAAPGTASDGAGD